MKKNCIATDLPEFLAKTQGVESFSDSKKITCTAPAPASARDVQKLARVTKNVGEAIGEARKAQTGLLHDLLAATGSAAAEVGRIETKFDDGHRDTIGAIWHVDRTMWIIGCILGGMMLLIILALFARPNRKFDSEALEQMLTSAIQKAESERSARSKRLWLSSGRTEKRGYVRTTACTQPRSIDFRIGADQTSG